MVGFTKTEFNLAGKYKDHFTQIVVHRKEMTSYVLMRSLLMDEGVREAEIKQMLFYNARMGEEHIWTRWRLRKKYCGRKLPFAYLTGDRNHAVEQYLAKKAVNQPFYEHPDTKYKDVLHTALVTSARHWKCRHDFVCELLEGVKKGIEIIYNDQEWAAQCLIRDVQLRKLLPGNQTTTQIRGYLDSVTTFDAYAPNLKVQQSVFDNALAMHARARPVNTEDGIVEDQEIKDISTQICHSGVKDRETAPYFRYYGTEPTEDVQHRRSPFIIWLGIVLGFAAAAFSLVRANPAVFRPAAEWFCAKGLLGSNAFFFMNWSIDKWIASLMSGLALWMLLPALSELLEGPSEKIIRTLLVFLASIFALMSLTYTLADWSTTVGVLGNLAVVFYAFYKFVRRFWSDRFSCRKWLIVKWDKILLSIDLACTVVSEWIGFIRLKKFQIEPCKIRWLWYFLPYKQRG